MKPEEVCDLQPSTTCKLVTNLVPHLESQTVCKDIPKEVCHLRLASPRIVKKPVTLRWCTKPKPKPSYGAPSYKAQPSYGPPPPLPPVYQPRTAKASDAPIPTESPVYYKPLDNSKDGRRAYRNIRY